MGKRGIAFCSDRSVNPCLWPAEKAGKPTSKPVPSKPGIVSGHVFAITGAGDIKPGRMATLVLLYCHRHLIETKQEDDEGSAYKAFFRRNI